MDKKKLLFVTYGGGHANIVQFVYRELIRRGETDCEILALTGAGLLLDKTGVPHKGLVDYIDLFEERGLIRTYGESLAEKDYNRESGICYEEIMLYLGIGFWDLTKKYGSEQAALEIYREQGRFAFEPIHAMRIIMEAVDPDGVILTSGVRMEKAAGLVANERGIPLIRIIDQPNLKVIPYRAQLCVMNQYTKEIIQNRFQIADHELDITGQPVFEHNLKLEQEKIEETKCRFHTKHYDRVVLILEAPDLKDTERIEKAVLELAVRCPGELFVIKLHPNQDMPGSLNDNPENVVFEKEYELRYLIAIADVAVTEWSTSGMEAVLMGKPLVIAYDQDQLGQIDYSMMGIAYRAESIEQLGEAIDLVCDGGSREAKALAAGREKFRNEENAASNVVDVIMREVEHGRRMDRDYCR